VRTASRERAATRPLRDPSPERASVAHANDKFAHLDDQVVHPFSRCWTFDQMPPEDPHFSLTVRIACPLRGAHCSLSGVGRASLRAPRSPGPVPGADRVEPLEAVPP
jgi:hypothetical protein